MSDTVKMKKALSCMTKLKNIWREGFWKYLINNLNRKKVLEKQVINVTSRVNMYIQK